jgi:uncharacterized membrane protein YkvA (DUF1232 family)
MKLKEKLKDLKLWIPTIYIALKDQETNVFAKFFATLTIMYALSPIDLIPDFIPILGYLDDLIILPLLIFITIQFINKDQIMIYKERAQRMSQTNIQKHFMYAIPILLIWMYLLYVLIAFIWKRVMI